ncbi:flagellar hook protein FlgE [Paraburkholderia youngii]|uniref:Flagellar hook protein FlgE n=1 Tax=Paraburkholderia youngii TaxID=2782701 RepID=A0A7W8NZ13_9BURK|nr:flagellar hook protein FlgE [Paraburkholderia youngii]MBB5398504.1 flagellar hook protein FlgE [Paraburkholderia youngii]NVI07843.1 flagellar hook protein FlgE [Paraburkholderia youngii]
MSYQTGLSGLHAASNDLDVIGNNIANAHTVGFKQGMAVFSDMYANAMLGATNNQIGIGVATSTIVRDFSEGTPTQTANPLDLDIRGNGFFLLSQNGTLVYSRNGQFQQDSDGNIINSSNGLPLMGYAVGPNSVVDTSRLVQLTTATVANLPPKLTSAIAWSFNLNAGDETPKVTPFDPTNNQSYNFATTATTYDSEGNEHQISIYLVKDPATPNQWSAYIAPQGSDVTVDNGTGAPSPYKQIGTLTFDSSGRLTSSSSLSFGMDTTNGSASPQTIAIDLGNTTQYAATTDSVTRYHPDGYAAAAYNGTLSVADDGTITAGYTNGETLVIGQVATATFANPNGLQSQSGNLFYATLASGAAQIGTPGTFNHGVLQGFMQESSNVDLTDQLVALITAQRNYQANAQTIKTQQTVDQSLINL